MFFPLTKYEHFVEFFQDVLSRPAEEFGNDEAVETMWAMKAFEHAEIYFNVCILYRRTSFIRFHPADMV